MADEVAADRGGGSAASSRLRKAPAAIRALGIAYAAPLLSVVATTLLGFALAGVLPTQAILLIYLGAVVISALVGGRVPAALAAVLGVVAYDYCFTAPRWTLTVADPAEVTALVMFMVVALATGSLAARRGDDVARAEAHAAATEGLLDFSSKLAGAVGAEATFATIAGGVHRMLGVETMVLAERDGDFRLAASAPNVLGLGAEELAAARAARDSRTPTGAGTQIHPGSTFAFTPVVTAHRLMAVVGTRPRTAATVEQGGGKLMDALLDQAGVAIDRAMRAQEAGEAALLRESERLQAALLSSLSHDFRTPLASITGAASSLRQLGERMDAATRDDLLASIEEDADRLNRFVGNLMDMSRIETGRLTARRDPVDVVDVVAGALARIRSAHPDFAADVSAANDLPPALADALLLEQVVFNLLDNARKYAGDDGPVTVFLRREGEAVSIAVTDRGRGISAGDLERIFDKFYRGGGDRSQAGTGLGLSIARGFVTAMGGTITVQSPAQRRRGTRFAIRLPAAA